MHLMFAIIIFTGQVPLTKIGFVPRLGKIIKKKQILGLQKEKQTGLKAQWVNETRRDLQAKVIKTAAFCHNRALRDLYREIERERERVMEETSERSKVE
jgi:hypothetical protein